MFGGQSHYNFDNDLASYVSATREEIYQDIFESLDSSVSGAAVYSKTGIEELTERRVRDKVAQAMQIVVCNLNSMHSRAGQLWAV